MQQDAHAGCPLHLLNTKRVEPGPLDGHSHELVLASQAPLEVPLETRPLVTGVVASSVGAGRLAALFSDFGGRPARSRLGRRPLASLLPLGLGRWSVGAEVPLEQEDDADGGSQKQSKGDG